MRKIKKPYANAFITPFFLSCDCFVKKETVNGIIGKVHGMIKPSNPPKMPRIKICHKLFDPSAPVPPHPFAGFVISTVANFKFEFAATPPSSGTENENGFDG